MTDKSRGVYAFLDSKSIEKLSELTNFQAIKRHIFFHIIDQIMVSMVPLVIGHSSLCMEGP